MDAYALNEHKTKNSKKVCIYIVDLIYIVKRQSFAIKIAYYSYVNMLSKKKKELN